MKYSYLLLFVSITFSLSSGCSKKGCTDPVASNYNSNAVKDNGSCVYESLTNELKKAYVANYANIAHAVYEDAFLEAQALQSAVKSFVDEPSAAGFDACREAWIMARIAYSQAEALRFSFGPIDAPNDNVERRLNAWNFEAAYIDYVKDSAGVGLINDTVAYPELNSEILIGMNDAFDGTRITLGYHVIEFLLWGEDHSDPEDKLTGKRSYKDYNTNDTTVLNPGRRAQYLELCTDQLMADLAKLVNEWSPYQSGNYRGEFLQFHPRKATRYTLTGLVGFAQFDLARHRILNTLSGNNPEREESAFSDNTYRDIYYNVICLRNFFGGRYGRVDSTYVEGTSLYDVIFEFDETLAAEMQALSKEVIDKAKAIPYPYDYHVSIEQAGGVGPVNELQEALELYGEKMTEIATEMNMGIIQDLPRN